MSHHSCLESFVVLNAPAISILYHKYILLTWMMWTHHKYKQFDLCLAQKKLFLQKHKEKKNKKSTNLIYLLYACWGIITHVELITIFFLKPQTLHSSQYSTYKVNKLWTYVKYRSTQLVLLVKTLMVLHIIILFWKIVLKFSWNTYVMALLCHAKDTQKDS